MKYTEHYELAKPEMSDLYADYIAAQSENAEKIDAALYELSQSKGGALGSAKMSAYAAISQGFAATVTEKE